MQNSWQIELSDLTIGYGENVVLDNINAVLPGGKITAVLGGSGCGKSTLLRHIIGLSRPMAGKVLLGEHDVFALPHKDFRRIRRRMGVLFQDGALLGSMTVADNVALPLSEHTKLAKKLIREIVEHKLSLVGLADFADYFPSELSGGMRKRAGLARAIVTDPPVLLCDEPTSGLDPISAAQMDALLLGMKKEYPDMTIVSVSHDMQSVKAIADHVIVLHNKKVAYSGNRLDLENTQDKYLRQFLDRKPLAAEDNKDARKKLSQQTKELLQNAVGQWFRKV